MRSFFVTIAVLCVLCSACVNRGGKAAVSHSGPYVLEIPTPPVMMDPAGEGDFLCEHFWDNFDFSDTTIPQRIDSTSFGVSFMRFAALLESRPDGGVEAMRSLMDRASANAEMLELFSGISRQLFWDPNSQMRNDELYLPVLEVRAESPFLDDAERDKAAFQASVAMRNRVGSPAEDFSYLTIQGRPGSLYAIKAPDTLIFFNNPGCTMCRDIRQSMLASPLIEEMVSGGKLVVLALYPDEDTDLWLSYRDEIPSNWINARDPGSTLHASGLYDLKAIPSLYLLDAKKTVLLKDCTDVLKLEAKLSE